MLWGPQVPYHYRPGADDFAAPGRMGRDVLRVNAADEPWMDMRGNLHELSLDDRVAKTFKLGVHYDAFGRRNEGASQQVQPELKIAQAGGRCMRFKDR